MTYQLCMRDEYGQGSILFSDSDLEKVIDRCKREVQAVNVDNALTVADKKRNWESFMVKIEINDEDQYEGYELYYAGKDGRGKDQVFNDSDEVKQLSDVDSDLTLRMYCGQLDGKDWFATVPSRTVRGEEDEVDSLTHEALQGKNVYYIRPV